MTQVIMFIDNTFLLPVRKKNKHPFHLLVIRYIKVFMLGIEYRSPSFLVWVRTVENKTTY